MTRKENIGFSVVLIGICCGGFIYSLNKIEPTPLPIHPYLVPTIVIGIALFLSIIRLIQAIGMPKKGEEKAAALKIPLKSVITLALILLYAWLYKPLGFILATALYMTLQMLLLWKNKEKWWLIPVIEVVFILSIYFLFTRVFSVQLPAGVLDFI